MLTNSHDIIRRLEREGFVLVRTKGSHHIFRQPATGLKVVVPHPRKDLPIGTVRNIYKSAGFDKA